MCVLIIALTHSIVYKLYLHDSTKKLQNRLLASRMILFDQNNTLLGTYSSVIVYFTLFFIFNATLHFLRLKYVRLVSLSVLYFKVICYVTVVQFCVFGIVVNIVNDCIDIVEETVIYLEISFYN